jgi:CIC family chloride channel protein
MSDASSPMSAPVGSIARLLEAQRRMTAAFRQEQFFLLLAIFIGVFSGMAVVCFRIAIEWTRWLLLGSGLSADPWRTVAVPAAAGLVIALLVVRVFPAARGSGVNQTKAAVYIYDGFIPFNTVVGKFLTSALAIGSGHSLGPEDPSLQVGAGLASAMGRRLRLTRDRLRLIAPLGAAAGLAAAFNSPIAAVLFVIEEVIGKWSSAVLGAVVLSAVSSTVVARWFLGSEPLFRIPAIETPQPVELVAYAALGIVGGMVSLLFVKLVSALRPRLRAFPRWTHYLQPALAGLIVGGIGIGFPHVMGAGYEYIDQAMHGQYTWQLLAILVGLKLLATAVSFSSGTPGGLFAPTLFMGAMLGAAVAGVMRLFVPDLGGSVGTFALVGMGTLFAGILRAPMTSVFMILEISGNYGIILPVMISNTLAYLISRSAQRVPIFDLLSRQDGLDLPSMEEQREEAVLHVEDAMQAVAIVPLLRPEESLREAAARLRESEVPLAMVDGDGAASAFLAREAITEAAERTPDAPLLSLLNDHRLPHLHPDQPLEIALRYADWPMIAVVHRADLRRLLGVVTLQDVMRTYRAAAVVLSHATPGPEQPR